VNVAIEPAGQEGTDEKDDGDGVKVHILEEKTGDAGARGQGQAREDRQRTD